MNKVEKIKAEIGIRIAEICDLTAGCIMDNKTAAEYRLLYELASFINSLEEEPVSNDLEEAAKNYEEDAVFYAARRISDFFKAGAQWQKERILNNAIEREVKVDAGGYPYIDVTELYDYDKDRPLAKEGDKVKLIIIMEE